jgi:GNAT superfamily N-acetyltransferase
LSPAGNPLEIEIQPISRHFDLSSFDCGISALNDYLQKYARQNHNRDLGKTFVALEKKNEKKVLGFYTAVASEIDKQLMPPAHSKHLPRYPLPAIRIGRLAVDKRHHGRGIGGGLLWDALDRANRLSKEVGVYAVVVDAKDDKAAQFYLKYGFLPLSNMPLTLFLPIESIHVLFSKG